MIQVSDVTLRYPNAEKDTLIELSLHCPKGSYTLISGGTGSGKSTIFRMLSGELSPTSGSAKVGEFALDGKLTKNLAAYRRSIGLVFQDFRLLEEKTIGGNIAFALDILPKPGRYDSAKRLASVLERFGLVEVRDQFPRALSHGEQQRAAIARAVVREPYVLIADDPTGQLDSGSANVIADILAREHERGMTVIVLTTEPTPLHQGRKDIRAFRLEQGRLLIDDQS